MNWEAVGAEGEILGAFAVIITLGYLAVQVRQNTRAMQASARVALHDAHMLTHDNERYIAGLMKSRWKAELTPEERTHRVERFFAIMKTFEGIWLQYQPG